MTLKEQIPAGAKKIAGLRPTRHRILVYLTIMGPGLIAANAGNDAGGIATYSSAGASYGYSLLWMLVLITFSLIVVQEMCARMGAATGQGLSDLIRENFGIRWTVLVMLCLFIANTGTIASEFVGIAASLELFGISKYLSVPIVALILWSLIVQGSYKLVERIFLAMSLVFLGYIGSAFLAGPNWGEALRQTVVPSFSFDSGYLTMFIATVGTTITPYMQLYIQSSVAEKGVTMRDYPYERADVIMGSIFSNTIAFFIVVCTAATLFVAGIHVNTAADAAKGLEPLAGPYAETLFAIGLFGASMLAAGVLPLATAYSLTEALGFEKGVSRSFEEAPVFMSIFTALIIFGAAVSLIPGLPLIQALIVVQVLNGVLLPVILVSILKIVNNQEVMGEHVNGPLQNVIAWATTIAVSGLSILLVVSNFAPGLMGT
ncbi:MAG: Nramp family divalent metal transporter [Chloroflexi bacterium]|nr:Nramp family divalent metal transporter [Chloroflexota bacterium]MDA8189653.1 Nramp family divalent metal transporter [Dehalococcoidales bacterium]